MPSNLPGGGFGDLAVFGQFGVKNNPEKKLSKCVWGYFGGIFMMFSDGVDAFWDLQTPIYVLLIPREASRCLRACKRRVGDLAVFGRFGVKNDPKKKFPNVFGYTLGGYL